MIIHLLFKSVNRRGYHAWSLGINIVAQQVMRYLSTFVVRRLANRLTACCSKPLAMFWDCLVDTHPSF